MNSPPPGQSGNIEENMTWSTEWSAEWSRRPWCRCFTAASPPWAIIVVIVSHFSVLIRICRPISQNTRDVHSMLVQFWARVVDDGPTWYQQRVNVPCLLGTDKSD